MRSTRPSCGMWAQLSVLPSVISSSTSLTAALCLDPSPSNLERLSVPCQCTVLRPQGEVYRDDNCSDAASPAHGPDWLPCCVLPRAGGTGFRKLVFWFRCYTQALKSKDQRPSALMPVAELHPIQPTIGNTEFQRCPKSTDTQWRRR